MRGLLRRVALGLGVLALAFAGAFGGARPALAWGEQGHRLIAEIALANVSPRTAAAIAELLRAEQGLTTPACHVTSLADAAVWPDCLRGDPDRWHYTFAWHYQGGPVCAAAFDVHAFCPGGNCITAQIERDRAVLANRGLPAAQRLAAMAFLAHFVGDIHMPLHAADNNDRGGNDVIASWPGHPEGNLHQMWDTTMAETAIASAPGSGRGALVRAYAPAEKARLGGGGVAEWAQESWVLAKGFVYPQAFGGDVCQPHAAGPVQISQGQINAGAVVARKRLVQAGLRLARVLDEALGR